jgi:inhibitor of cysteine peptidase
MNRKTVGCPEGVSGRFKGLAPAAALVALLVLVGGLSMYVQLQLNQPRQVSMERFDTCSDIADAFNQSAQAGYYRGWGVLESISAPTAQGEAKSDAASEYSTTNIQVEGVDEADIMKTDGQYIYTLSGSRLVIVRAWPADDAEVLSETDLGNFSPREMFIDDGMLMLFGSTSFQGGPVFEGEEKEIYPYPYWYTMTTVQLWDVSDREDPEMERSVDFEGDYLTSRKIGDYVYFVINSYPRIYALPQEDPGEIIPLYRDRSAQEIESAEEEDYAPACGCAEVAYFEPVNAQSFITLASMSISDPDADVEKEVIAGSGQNVYASQDNIYIAEYYYSPWFWGIRAPEGGEPTESTFVHKFSLDSGEIEYLANAEVPGHVLNQFSMDEFEGHFRIATTTGRVSQMGGGSTNNIYVYDEGMELTGKLEDLAPGEQIYSARFMGERGYLVTFKKIDPLFVIDLSDPARPRVLGKLKIPGYSDYLHPYDEDHLIGIGKETVEAEEEGRDFSWYQGVKLALFDVSDVENPVELHKVVIGDRGTDSEILRDHKAFLFDRERELLVIPILLAELKGDPSELPDWSYGEYVYQGAYVYSLNLEDGFDLRGRITHYDDDEAFEKSGYYFSGNYNIERSLYIEDVLYTLSQHRLKLNDLSDLDELAVLDFGDPEEYGAWGIREDIASI